MEPKARLEYTVTCEGLSIPYVLKPSRRRRTLSLQVDGAQRVTVYSPHRMPLADVARFVHRHAGWIRRKVQYFADLALRCPPVTLSPEEIRRYREEAARLADDAVRRYAPLAGAWPSRVLISNPKRRWGSCSPTGGIRLNWRLVLMPREVLDYVVVHELAHLRHANHSARFWSVVAAVMPKYQEHRAWLRTRGPGFAAVR